MRVHVRVPTRKQVSHATTLEELEEGERTERIRESVARGYAVDDERLEGVADVVIALALTHWLVACSGALGSLDSTLALLARLSTRYVLVEFIGRDDDAIEGFHHTDGVADYSLSSFTSGLRSHFATFACVARVRPHRLLFVAVKRREDAAHWDAVQLRTECAPPPPPPPVRTATGAWAINAWPGAHLTFFARGAEARQRGFWYPTDGELPGWKLSQGHVAVVSARGAQAFGSPRGMPEQFFALHNAGTYVQQRVTLPAFAWHAGFEIRFTRAARPLYPAPSLTVTCDEVPVFRESAIRAEGFAEVVVPVQPASSGRDGADDEQAARSVLLRFENTGENTEESCLLVGSIVLHRTREIAGYRPIV